MARRYVIAAVAFAGVAGAAYLMGRSFRLILLLFAGVLLSIFLRALTEIITNRVRMRQLHALGIVLGVLAALIAGFALTAGRSVARQMDQLGEELPRALSRLETEVKRSRLGRMALERANVEQGVGQAQVVRGATRAVRLTTEALTGAAIVFFVGVFIAAEPRAYAEGVTWLIPRRHRPRARKILDELDHTLRWWLIARGGSMLAVWILVSIGLLILGAPLALALGLLAGLLDFIPYFGPVLAAVPGILLAMVDGPQQALMVAGLYALVQAIESNLLQPILERRTVRLLPAMGLGFQVILGYFAGILGAALASPLLAGLKVLVGRLYVEETLGDVVLDIREEREAREREKAQKAAADT